MALSPRHQEFINQYIACYFNATEAYSRVYPNATRETARRNGHELLTNTDIDAEIKRRIAELIMGPDEVMVRFTEQAKAEYSQYFTPNGTVDLKKLIADGKAHLIKSIKETKYGTNVEFYDAHAAKELLGKHHKLFTEQVEHRGETVMRVVYGDDRTNDSTP